MGGYNLGKWPRRRFSDQLLASSSKNGTRKRTQICFAELSSPYPAFAWNPCPSSPGTRSRPTIGQVTDQQPELSGRNMTPSIHRHRSACCQNTNKGLHVREVLVVVAKTNRLKWKARGRTRHRRDCGTMRSCDFLQPMDYDLEKSAICGSRTLTGGAKPVFVKQVVRRFHAASLISEALLSRSGFSHRGIAFGI